MRTLSEKLERRRARGRPRKTVSLRLPEDIVEDLDEMAPVVGFRGHESLIRVYISEGLRRDEARMERPEVRALLDSLRRHGIADDIIAEVLAETLQQSA